MMRSANEIRRQFLDFFRSKGHQIVPSAPIVIKNDPTLLFTNAGMNQFKDYFLGNREPEARRIADTQKCLRVSGKHNDLEEVGVDTYHHTMFEMLGNWSFGDYFKKEAIDWSWELLTEVYQLPKDRLYVTVFEGDPKENLPRDEEAFSLWKKHLPEARILFGNKKDNFWEMGETGPCGPCSEIHVDCRNDEERNQSDGAQLVNADHPQVIEIWNNVFMQFNRLKDGRLESLPAQHVDTGMGLERLVRVIQQKQSNYDTDLFTTTIAATEKLVAGKYDFSDSKQAIAFRVIADHIRAISFTIADGQLPSNTGAGYVIRRILRRAVRYYFSYLNYKQPLLCQLIPGLAEQFAEVFPELRQQLDFVSRVIREEEEAFLKTLDKGLKRLDEAMREAREGTLAGALVFELYDTYGFPIDLTRLIAQENKLNVDEAGFEHEMQQQKTRSRAAGLLETDDWVVLSDAQGAGFRGYTETETASKLLKYRKVKNKGKELYQFVLDETPFYAESGGQVGDTGVLLFDGSEVRIVDTKKENELIIHFSETLPQEIGANLTARIDTARRGRIALHHSATHLLHAALRQVLGTHVAQKGSLVNADYLRFDFSHFAKMTDEELRSVEQIVNEKIRENIPVVIRTLPKEEALKLGAMALFGEKYGDNVRVVTMDPGYSVELCGGTHVGSTGELGFFKIVSESAVAAGVRRVEAMSGAAAEHYIADQLEELKAAKTLVKNPKQLPSAIEYLLEEQTQLRKKLEQLELKSLQAMADQLSTQTETVNGKEFLGTTVQVSGAEALKKLATLLRDRAAAPLIVLGAAVEGKAQVIVSVPDSAARDKTLDATQIIRQTVAPLIKGGGGGQAAMASAGGQDAGQLGAAIDAVKKLL